MGEWEGNSYKTDSNRAHKATDVDTAGGLKGRRRAFFGFVVFFLLAVRVYKKVDEKKREKNKHV